MEPSRPMSPHDGSKLLKDFVHRSEQRRVACRYARAGRQFTPRCQEHQPINLPHRPHTARFLKDDQVEFRSGTTVATNNQIEEETPAETGGLPTSKYAQCKRPIEMTSAILPTATVAAARGLGVTKRPVFTFTRRKLQMEGILATSRNRMMMRSVAAGRATSQHIGRRTSVTMLTAKLDSILRSSPWMRRRKVVLLSKLEDLRQGGLLNASMPRTSFKLPSLVSQPFTHQEEIDTAISKASAPDHKYRRKSVQADNDSREAEKRILVILKRFVRLWRSRKQRSEDAALTILSGIGSDQQCPSLGFTKTDAARGGKFKRELDAQSISVAGILSRRMVGEVPALQFFEEGEPLVTGQSQQILAELTPFSGRAESFDIDHEDDSSLHSKCLFKSQAQNRDDMTRSPSVQNGDVKSPSQRHAKPKGVCYSLNTSGGRQIKIQSGAPGMDRLGSHTSPIHQKCEDITVERSTNKCLQRRMIYRIKVKRQAISKLTYAFTRSKQVSAAKLKSQLALHQAESEQLFGKRYSLLLSSDASLPPHMTSKELYLARLRYRKATLLARYQSLELLGAALHRIETAGEVSGLRISSGEQRFLELLRSTVEGDHVITPLLTDNIRKQFTAEQQQKPLVAGLLGLLERAI